MSDFVNTIDLLGDDVVVNSILDGSITEFNDNVIKTLSQHVFASRAFLTSVSLPNVSEIGESAFNSCSSLKSVDVPNVTLVDDDAFFKCTELTTISLPSVTKIDNGGFEQCGKLSCVDLPLVQTVGDRAFSECYSLTRIDLPSATRIYSSAFLHCTTLVSLILRLETKCVLSNTSAFKYCYHMLGTTDSTYNPDGLHDGYIYVPRALVESYQSDSVWGSSTLQFRALEDYTVDGTITGELDETKI